ncbi:hypothetical protein J2Y38_001491 [Flavobacterium sp. 2755]|uniref:hypothetical protein n=1 Tax=Flavobacterium sp. 2755 TaxID=2817765 RepID=UPI002859DA50|nr:hypothetical protein [Flavobacterium sp. 2755]MDR6761282.1 hypothetical protein [Flavobacterium sp. 2755]
MLYTRKLIFKLSFLFCLLLSFFIFSFQTKNEEVLIVSYSAISCPCAQWKIENKNNTSNIYLERVNSKLLDANHIWDGKTLPLKLKIKGYFKKEPGIPKDFTTKGDPKPAKIFLYTEIKVIK